MAEEKREMNQLKFEIDKVITKPFSQESYNINDDTAKKVTRRVFKQFGIKLNDFTPKGYPFYIDLVGQFKSRTIYVECARTHNPMWNDFKFPNRWDGVHVPMRKEQTLNADKWPKDLNVRQKDIWYSLVNRYLSFVAVCFDTSKILKAPQLNMVKTPMHQKEHTTPDSFYIVPIEHWKIKENPQPNIQAPTNEI